MVMDTVEKTVLLSEKNIRMVQYLANNVMVIA